MYALRVSQHLLDSRVNLGASRLDELECLLEPALYLADVRLEIGLVYLKLCDCLVGSPVDVRPECPLDLDGRFNLKSVHSTNEVLNAQNRANHDEVENSTLAFVILNLPEGFYYLWRKKILQLR